MDRKEASLVLRSHGDIRCRCTPPPRGRGGGTVSCPKSALGDSPGGGGCCSEGGGGGAVVLDSGLRIGSVHAALDRGGRCPRFLDVRSSAPSSAGDVSVMGRSAPVGPVFLRGVQGMRMTRMPPPPPQPPPTSCVPSCRMPRPDVSGAVPTAL